MIHDDRIDRECDTIGANLKQKVEDRTWLIARRLLLERGPTQP